MTVSSGSSSSSGMTEGTLGRAYARVREESAGCETGPRELSTPLGDTAAGEPRALGEGDSGSCSGGGTGRL
jgi:hypothetical protein